MAITTDGILVNIDGNSNRVSAYAYGPRKLVLIVGMNKVAYSARTAHPFRGNGAPFRFKLSKAQLVD